MYDLATVWMATYRLCTATMSGAVYLIAGTLQHDGDHCRKWRKWTAQEVQQDVIGAVGSLPAEHYDDSLTITEMEPDNPVYGAHRRHTGQRDMAL